jgi:hypothetical protein
MKRMLLLLVSLLLISSVAMADHIGLYRDATGGSCYLGAPGQFNPNVAIIHKFTQGATGSRFKATFPAGTSFFGFNTPYVPIGLLTGDLSLGYGQCLSGSIVLGTINAIYGAGTAQILPADAFAYILYTDCSFGEYPATGGNAYIGGTGQCYPFAVEPSTWGSVKALYR